MDHLVQYWSDSAKKLMYKQISPTEVILLQVAGRDLSQDFSHRHEKVTFPSPSRLSEDISKMKESFFQDWEDLMNEYLQVNKEKLAIMNNHRQRQYERGQLR